MNLIGTKDACILLGRKYDSGTASPDLKRDLAKVGVKPALTLSHGRGPRYLYTQDDLDLAAMKFAKAKKAPKAPAAKPPANAKMRRLTLSGEIFTNVARLEEKVDQLGTLLAALVREFDGPSKPIARAAEIPKSNGAGTHA